MSSSSYDSPARRTDFAQSEGAASHAFHVFTHVARIVARRKCWKNTAITERTCRH
ncbi:hypothetical protein BURKHO8Y_140424 [Burkholderia sp. 8Y]|nr:hypothetical protein BURKHO8Y_140424 [Burkholderia sp. 8Y]